MREQAMKRRLPCRPGLIVMFILMLSTISGLIYAEAGDVLWSRVEYYTDLETPVGDTTKFTCWAIDVTQDNGCIVAGKAASTSSGYANRTYLIRLDGSGDVVWVHNYGWEFYSYNAKSVLAESDGGFVIAGDKQHPYYVSDIPPGNYDTGAFLIKVDSNGDTVWTACYNDDPGTYKYDLYDLCQTDDGGYALFGSTQEDKGGNTFLWKGFVIKTDSSGTEEWHKHYMGPSDETDTTWGWTNMVSLGGCVTSDDGYALTGAIQTIYLFDNGDRYITDNGMVLRVDSDGDSVYTYMYGEHDQFFDICATSDGGFFITDNNRDIFSSEIFNFIDQATTLKIDDSQNETWHYGVLFDGSGGDDTGTDTSSVGRAVCEVPDDGGFVLTGQRCWRDEDPYEVETTFNSELFLSHFDANGNLTTLKLYGDEFGGTVDMPIIPLSITVNEDGNYLICGFFYSVENDDGFLLSPRKGFVAEIEGVTTSIDDDNIAGLPDQVSLLQNYPNPFNATTQIQFALNKSDDVTLSVYDILGRQITTLYRGSLNAGTHSITWNGTSDSGEIVSSGVYFYRLETSKTTTSKQMILLK